MKFFTELKALMPEGYPVHFTAFKKGDEITVSISTAPLPDEDKSASTHKKNVDSTFLEEIKPCVIRGTAEELDAEFFAVIRKPQERIMKKLESNVAEVESSIDKAEEPPKKSAKISAAPKKEEKKEETKADKKKKLSTLISEGSQLMKNKKWAEALEKLKAAQELDPANKHIKTDITSCESWLKSKSLFDEDQTSAAPEKLKEIAKESPNVVLASAPKHEETEEAEEVQEVEEAEEPEEEQQEEPASDDPELELPIEL